MQLQSEREDTSEWIYIIYCWKEFATRKHQFSPTLELLKRATMVCSNNNPVVIGVAGTDIHISIFIQEPHFLCVESNPVSTITVQSLGTLPWSSRVFWKMQGWNWNELHIFPLCFQVLTYRHWWIGENYVIWTGYNLRFVITPFVSCLTWTSWILEGLCIQKVTFEFAGNFGCKACLHSFSSLNGGGKCENLSCEKPRIWWVWCCCSLTPFFLPLSIAWDWKMGFDTVSGSILSVSIYVSLVFWTVDIFLNLNTAVYIQGQLVTKRRAIFRRYLSTWFFLDVTIVILDYLNLAQDMQRGSKRAVISLKRSKTATLLRHSNIDLTRLIMNQASKAWKNETDRIQKSRLLARVYWRNDILIDLHRYRYS